MISHQKTNQMGVCFVIQLPVPQIVLGAEKVLLSKKTDHLIGKKTTYLITEVGSLFASEAGKYIVLLSVSVGR